MRSRSQNVGPAVTSFFVAYPAVPDLIGETIEAAAGLCRGRAGLTITTWKRPDLAGGPLIAPILESIGASEVVAADVTVLNFNVTYELGFAIGSGKRVLPIQHRAYEIDRVAINRIGIFDTL